MHINESLRGRELAAPQVSRQLIARDHVAGRMHQEIEDIEFNGGYVDAETPLPNFTAARIEPDLADLDARGASGGNLCRPPQNRAHPGQEFVWREWLRDVVIGAAIQSGNTISGSGTSGQHDHRGVHLVVPEALQYFEAVQEGKHDIEENQIEAARRGSGDRGHSVVYRRKAEIMGGEELGHQVAKPDIIVHQ